MAKFWKIAVASVVSIICVSCADFLEIETKGGNTPVGPTTEMTVVTKHVSAEYNNGAISDVHEAALVNVKDLNEVFENKKYTATHAVTVSEAAGLKRSEAVALVGKTVIYNGGFALTDNCTITVSVKMTGCETVRFTTNKTTYCHPNFATSGAVASLEACGYVPTSLAIKSAEGNKLNSEITVKGDEEEVTIPTSILFAEDDVISYEFDNFRVTGKGTATLNEYKTINGVRTGDVKVLNGTFNVQFTAGAEIVKTSTASPVLNNTVITVNGNNCHFSYTLNGKEFSDNWTVIVPEAVEFTASNGSIVRRSFEGAWTVNSKSFSNIATVWSNRAALSIAGFEQAEDTQVIRINAPVDPTIPGYKLIRADQTDRYNGSRDRWVSTPICAWFQSTVNSNETLFVAFDETTGREIYRETTSGKSLPTEKLAMVYNGTAFVGGFVVRSESAYIYMPFDRSFTAAVSVVSTTTARLRDPYQNSGVYNAENETTTFSLENGSKLVLK